MNTIKNNAKNNENSGVNDNTEDCLDGELDTTFPASDPIAISQPHKKKTDEKTHLDTSNLNQ